ncbi:hypothetical protein SDC9_74662 [bioreactor metagenome]|uniref:Aspartate racemase n=1 Tax=bioreactor metagenome TaxID=1076179 RepID=A0A644YNR4_9ZZZZ
MKTIGLIGGMSWESTVTYYNTNFHPESRQGLLSKTRRWRVAKVPALLQNQY